MLITPLQAPITGQLQSETNTKMNHRWMRKASIIAISLFTPFAQAHYDYSHDYLEGHSFAIQGAIATGGNLGIGIVDFTQHTEIGVTLSASTNDAPYKTETITPVIFLGLRNALCEHTYFAWGVDMNRTFGKIDGSHIRSDGQAGVYVSLEQMLSNHVMVVGWIQPYQYAYRKLSGIGVSSHHYFSTGGIGINYLF